METIIKTALYAHILSGGIALVTGFIAVIAKKGSKPHLKSGIIYYWSMLFVAISGMIVGSYKQNIFLCCIAIFSFYMVFTGKRVFNSKKKIHTTKMDWLLVSISFVIGLLMVSYGVLLFIKYGFFGLVPMLLVFGALLVWMVLEDFFVMKNNKYKKGQYLITHIARMSGSYIATTTAFLVVNIRIEPQWIVWLLPTVIGTPLITRATRKWKVKFVNPN